MQVMCRIMPQRAHRKRQRVRIFTESYLRDHSSRPPWDRIYPKPPMGYVRERTRRGMTCIKRCDLVKHSGFEERPSRATDAKRCERSGQQ